MSAKKRFKKLMRQRASAAGKEPGRDPQGPGGKGPRRPARGGGGSQVIARGHARVPVPAELGPEWRVPFVLHKNKRAVESEPGPFVFPNLNGSLLWHRYLPVHATRLTELITVTGEGGGELRRRLAKELPEMWSGHGVLQWFADRVGGAMDADLFNHLVARRRSEITSRGGRQVEVVSAWRLLPGLGNASTFEGGGLAWHGTYGCPILTGSSVKGLLRHYLEQEILELGGELPAELAGLAERLEPGAELVDVLFGDISTGAESTGPGWLEVWDGWPLSPPEDWFEPEVLTPHHKRYLQASEAGEVPAPSDQENPEPVQFLAIRPGVRFAIPVVPASQIPLAAGGTEKLLLAAEWLLLRALDEWGIGARTGSGFGRLTRPEGRGESN